MTSVVLVPAVCTTVGPEPPPAVSHVPSAFKNLPASVVAGAGTSPAAPADEPSVPVKLEYVVSVAEITLSLIVILEPAV